MPSIAKLIFSAAVLALSQPTWAALQVFACEPEWSALVKELGGDDVQVYTATAPRQDPHHVQARPSLIAKLRRADLLVCTGADLEVGWLPVLLRQAANPAVQPGRAGHFLASEFVAMQEIPTHLDRSLGDIHPHGNPHIHLDPRNLLRVAAALAARLRELDPANAGVYEQHSTEFLQRWETALARWELQVRPLQDLPVVTHHRDWVYLFRWMGIRALASLEPKPGIPPSSAHLSTVLAELRARPAAAVVLAAYQNPRAARWLAGRADVSVVELPYTVGGSEQATDLFGLFDDTIRRLLMVVQ